STGLCAREWACTFPLVGSGSIMIPPKLFSLYRYVIDTLLGNMLPYTPIVAFLSPHCYSPLYLVFHTQFSYPISERQETGICYCNARQPRWWHDYITLFYTRKHELGLIPTCSDLGRRETRRGAACRA